MQLGNMRQRRPVQQVEGENDHIDSSFFQVDLTINGNVFRTNAENLLVLQRDEGNELSDADLDYSLERCAYWSFTFTAAAEELILQVSRLKREMDMWFGEIRDTATRRLVEARRTLVRETAATARDLGSMTKEELRQFLASQDPWKDHYHEKMAEIELTQKNANILQSLAKNMESRGMHLQSIAKRRTAQRERNS